MPYPPPPGLNSSQSSSARSSLPPRPPPSSNTFRSNNHDGGGSTPAFTGFAPRAVAAQSKSHTTLSAGPTGPSSSYGNINSPAASASIGPANPYQQQQPQSQANGYAVPYNGYGAAASYEASSYAAPQIRNPFAPPTAGDAGSGPAGAFPAPYDPELEAQIAQWQSAYASTKDDRRIGGNANFTPLGPNSREFTAAEVSAAGSGDSGVASVVTGADGKRKTVVRSGGGQTWQDPSLLEWDPSHFRIFVGNLAGEVTDDSLLKAFAKYPSVQRARVVREKRTTKSKGYGFVSFSDGDDYFQAAREMQGRYIGSHPVLIKKSTTDIKAVTPKDKNKKGKHKSGGGGANNDMNGGYAGTGAGVQKKQSKTKGGLKILG